MRCEGPAGCYAISRPTGGLTPRWAVFFSVFGTRAPLGERLRRGLHWEASRFGTHASSVHIDEVRRAFEVRIKLEGLAGELAARRITPDKLEELGRLIGDADQILVKMQLP